MYFFFELFKLIEGWFNDRRSLKYRVNKLKKAGITKTVFDFHGYIIVIQSHDHVDDFRA